MLLDHGFAEFFYKFLRFGVVLTAEDVHRGCHDVLGGQGILKK